MHAKQKYCTAHLADLAMAKAMTRRKGSKRTRLLILEKLAAKCVGQTTRELEVCASIYHLV